MQPAPLRPLQRLQLPRLAVINSHSAVALDPAPVPAAGGFLAVLLAI